MMEREPCKRASGSYRAYFETQEEAIAFATDPGNPCYHGDVTVFCGRCGYFHLSKLEWLQARPWETPVTQLRVA